MIAYQHRGEDNDFPPKISASPSPPRLSAAGICGRERGSCRCRWLERTVAVGLNAPLPHRCRWLKRGDLGDAETRRRSISSHPLPTGRTPVGPVRWVEPSGWVSQSRDSRTTRRSALSCALRMPQGRAWRWTLPRTRPYRRTPPVGALCGCQPLTRPPQCCIMRGMETALTFERPEEPPEPQPPKPGCGCGCLLVIIVIILLALLGSVPSGGLPWM